MFGSIRLTKYCQTVRDEGINGSMLKYLIKNEGLGDLEMSKLEQARLINLMQARMNSEVETKGEADTNAAVKPAEVETQIASSPKMEDAEKEKERMEAEMREKMEAQMKAELKEKLEAEMKTKMEAEMRELAEKEKKQRQLEAELRAKAEAEMEAKLELERQAKLKAEMQVKAEAEKKTKLEQAARDQVQAEANAKKEIEMKANAEAELRAKMEAEMKARVEAEMRAKLEAEMKAKFEREMKATAEPATAEPAVKVIKPAEAEVKVEKLEPEPKIFEALRSNDEALVCSLLTERADPNALDDFGGPPLDLAISWKSHTMAALLLHARADPNTCSVGMPRNDGVMFELLSNSQESMELEYSYFCHHKSDEWREARQILLWARKRLANEERLTQEREEAELEQAEEKRLEAEAEARKKQKEIERNMIAQFRPGDKVRLSKQGCEAPLGYDWSDEVMRPGDVGEVLSCRVIQGVLDIFLRGPRGRTESYDAIDIEHVA